jgi:hypothetical protein
VPIKPINNNKIKIFNYLIRPQSGDYRCDAGGTRPGKHVVTAASDETLELYFRLANGSPLVRQSQGLLS